MRKDRSKIKRGRVGGNCRKPPLESPLIGKEFSTRRVREVRSCFSVVANRGYLKEEKGKVMGRRH